MDKAHILSEIRRTAAANGGAALGRVRFEVETGINQRDWYGVYWARWKDALQEAGLAPNQLNPAMEESKLLECFARYALELGHLPTAGELRLKRRANADFPSWNTFGRFGTKTGLVKRLREFCRGIADLVSIVALCDSYLSSIDSFRKEPDERVGEAVTGHVYLIKSGRFYKVGRSNSVGRREYELAIQLPERVETVHVIRTDDPPGIEEYWHRRFAARRMNGEWFDLTQADVAAFKRRKFM